MNLNELKPGDVILTRNRGQKWQTKVAMWGISAAGRLRGQPDMWQHVIVASHHDANGTFWGIEGRPGVVGWVDLGSALSDVFTITNVDQPKNDDQRSKVLSALTPMIGQAKYDWQAIAVDGVISLGAASVVAPLWSMADKWGKGVPGHVVCSSLADFGYEVAGLKSPNADRYCMPSDWADFIDNRKWER